MAWQKWGGGSEVGVKKEGKKDCMIDSEERIIYKERTTLRKLYRGNKSALFYLGIIWVRCVFVKINNLERLIWPNCKK